MLWWKFVSFYSSFASLSSVRKDILLCTYLAQIWYTLVITGQLKFKFVRLSRTRVKIVKLLMSVLKRQVNSSSEFSSFFSVIRYYSYENSQLMLFLFWTKRSHPLPNNLYKSYAKCIQKLYKTLKLYLFCREMS